MKIQCNEKGSRFIDVTPEHFQTITKYSLLSDLVDSNGLVDENSLYKLQMNVKALLENSADNTDLLQLCRDVIFHDNMKPFGLHQLILAYVQK